MDDFDPRRCPRCDSPDTHWRSGVHFDHERRCVDCGKIWDPDDERQAHCDRERERLEFNTHRE